MALTDTAKRLLDTLDSLPEVERQEVFREVLRRAALSEHESPSGDDLIASAVPPLAESLASRFIGTWQLVAIRETDRVSGVETPAARGSASGQLIYAANGRLSVQIVRTGREKLPVGSAEGFASYFGRWELVPAEGCVIHYQDGNLNAAQVGQAPKRYYSFDATGCLALATPWRLDATSREVASVFVWERLP